MKISNIRNNVNFGLRIVKNQNYDAIVNFRREQGESEKEIADSFERISKLYNDNLSLEFCNPEKQFFDLFGISAIMCNIRLRGLMQASDSNKQYEVDTSSEDKTPSDYEISLTQTVKHLLRQEQKRIDAEDWGQ